MGPRVQITGRLLWHWSSLGLRLGLNQSVFHSTGCTRAGCRCQLHESYRLLVSSGSKTLIERTENTSVCSPIYKEPDEDGDAWGLGISPAKTMSTRPGLGA